MRTTSNTLNIWLAGYYDDFMSCRSVPDDSNASTVRDIDHTATHHGNPMNGEATLNPRYRYSLPDRSQLATYESANDNLTADVFFATSSVATISNSGIHEWLTLDTIRRGYNNWEGRAQLQYPDSRRGSRQRFNGAAGDSYEAFVNGHDTRGVYYAPLGDIDSTMGRSRVISRAARDSNSTMYIGAGSHQQAERAGHTTTHSISLASILSGERTDKTTTSSGANRGDARKHLYPLRSPAGQPFLISKLHQKETNTSGGNRYRILNYDGKMQFSGLGDTFNIRMASHTFGDWAGQQYTLKIGYPKSGGFDKSTQTFSGTPAITINIPISDLASGNLEIDTYTYGNNNNYWDDIDIVMDFTAQTYKVYIDGTQLGGTGSMAGSYQPDDIFGWSLDVYNSGACSDGFVDAITCIDRAALYIPLQDEVQSTDYTPLKSFDYQAHANSLSTVSFTISDDDNRFGLTGLLESTGFTEWSALVFRDNLDRPIWWGTITNLRQSQNTNQQTLDTIISAEEQFGLMDRQLPIWELGQGSVLDKEGHFALNTAIEKNAELVANMKDILYTGGIKLQLNNSTIGFNNADFATEDNQRTSLLSSHPIQMYIGEDTNGPNDTEKEWEGYGSARWKLEESFGMFQNENLTCVLLSSDTQHTTSNTISTTNSSVAAAKNISSITAITNDSTAPDETPSMKVAVLAVNDSLTRGDKDCSTYEVIATNPLDTRKKLVEFQTTASHGYSEGDEIRFGIRRNSSTYAIDTTGNIFGGGQYRILAVPSTTKFQIEVTSTTLTTSSATGFGTGQVLPVLVSTNFNSGQLTNKHLVFNQSVLDFWNDSNKEKVFYRNVHAKWMDDISESLWFKSKFGIISKECYHTAGKNTITNNPVSPAKASSYSQDTATFTGISSISTTATSVTCDDPAIWYYKEALGKDGIIDIIDPVTNERNTLLFDGCTAPSEAALTYIQLNSGSAVTIDGQSWYNGFQVSNESLSQWDIVVHSGFADYELNGVHQVTGIYSQTGGVTKYVAIKIDTFTPKKENAGLVTTNLSWFNDPDDFYPRLWTYQNVQNTNALGGLTRTQEVVIRKSSPVISLASNNVATKTTGATGQVHYGSFTIQNIKGQRRAWTAGDFLYRFRKIDESNGYKHIWLLWSDMRNDGNADANNSTTKKDFGLVLPTKENYNVDMIFADQFETNGENSPFASLKIGEDIDIWNVDAEVEPYSGSAWSALGSNSYKLKDFPGSVPFNPYENWESKGGAFLIIDSSRFFNMNTESSGGRPGYTTGGMAHFDDYDIPIAGTPYLLDAYYKNAVSNYKNSGTSVDGTTTTNFANHENQLKFINDAATPINDIGFEDKTLELDDATNFDFGATDGYGIILATKGTGKDSEKYLFGLRWNTVTGNTLNNVYINDPNLTAIDPQAIITSLDEDSALWSSGSRLDIALKRELGDGQTLNENGYDEIVVYNTPAALYGFRILMNVDGYIEFKNGGTYYDSDKIRMLQNIAVINNWTNNATLSSIQDINNVPLTRNMTTTRIAYSSGDTENFGAITDLREKTFATSIRDIVNTSGEGSDGTNIVFSRVVGRDGRFDYRPSYNSGFTFTRNNMVNSGLSVDSSSIITNIRAFYNGGQSFVDYPKPSTGTEARWKVLDLSSVRNKQEAEAIAKREYHKVKTSSMSVSVKLNRESGENNVMLSNARYGYIGDAAIVGLYETDSEKFGSSWTSLYGGIPFTGIANALDGNTNSTEVTNDFTLVPMIDGTGNYSSSAMPGLEVISVVSSVQANGVESPLSWASSSNTLNWSIAFGSTVVSQVITSDGYYEIASGPNKITVKIDYSELPSSGTTTKSYAYVPLADADKAYNTYGAKSISYALQVVSVPPSVPKVNDENHELRVGISISGGSTADDARFKIHLLDYDFANTGSPAQFTETLNTNGSSEIEVYGNGFYEMDFPTSWGAPAGSKLVISVNTDYLRDVIRQRCNNKVKNANDIPGLSAFASTDSDSIFPLGFREFAEYGGMSEDRNAWYAPRLFIVDDIKYVPSTYCTITDSHIDLSSQSMVIQSVSWSQKERDHETVSLSLERNESRYKKSLANVFQNTSATGGVSQDISQQFMQEGLWLGNFNQTQGINTEGGSTTDGQNINTFSTTVNKMMKGVNETPAETTSPEGENGILGVKRVGVSASANLSIDGFDAITDGSGGVVGSDGFVLNGTYCNAEGLAATGVKHEQSFIVRIPSDSADSHIELLAKASLDGDSSNSTAVVTTKVESLDSGVSATRTTSVSYSDTNRSEYILYSGKIKGANAGSSLKVTLSRTPNTGDDDATYNALRIHTVRLSTRRHTTTNPSQAKTFKPYSS